jgi:hypothetical protein
MTLGFSPERRLAATEISGNRVCQGDSDNLLKLRRKRTEVTFLEWPNLLFSFPFAHLGLDLFEHGDDLVMAKTTRKVNKANHGRRPASSKARKAKRRKMGV